MVKVIHTGEEKRTVVFSLHLVRESRVMLAGTFNEWNPETLRMNREEENGVYSCTLHLPEGVYEYRFIIDGCWVRDHENEACTQSEEEFKENGASSGTPGGNTRENDGIPRKSAMDCGIPPFPRFP